MESGASLATRNPCLLASPRVKVGPGTVRFPGFRRRMRGARLVATGAFGRGSVSVESKLSCEVGEGGVGAIACGDHWRKNVYGFGDFGVTTSAARAFKKKFPNIRDFIGEDHEDGDDEEGEGGHGGSRGSDDDDDEEDTSTDEEDTSTDEEDTTEDEDEDEDDEEDEGECDD
ncbi:uncharacterized protein [Elaeis guineensis]|uniref:Coenzyme A biosynthesis protein 3 n=1 Tax=Elaeis guineensis var. tenera TaxID=51953 RepID=A0A6I9RX46_ELAGV|nr:coenzyme A biosynthesis protein 3 [Elaeis guineensis]